MASNTPSVGTSTWSQVSGPSTANFGAASSPASSVNISATGIYVFRWTIDNVLCAASTDDVAITFVQNPTITNAGPGQTNNLTCGQTSVTLAANAPSVGTGT